MNTTQQEGAYASAGQSFAAPASSPGLHRLALLTAGMTFVLIFVGGLVTSTGSALAVPDWPLAFGKLVPKLVGGVRFEYGHRVTAGIVVVLTLLLATWTWAREPRRGVRNTAFAALGLVILQAVLGGITVLLELPLPIAVAHAATAQAFLCLTVAMALFTDPRWESLPRLGRDTESPSLVALCTATTVVIYLQILIGAVMRHLGAGLAIPDFPLSFGQLMPPHFSLFVAISFAHRVGALVVSVFVFWTVFRVIGRYRGEPALLRPALALLVLLAVQISLGALTIWSWRAVIPTTAHVAGGAAVLAASLVLTLRARWLVRPPLSETAGARASVFAGHQVTA